jgi:hypothetical protein
MTLIFIILIAFISLNLAVGLTGYFLLRRPRS